MNEKGKIFFSWLLVVLLLATGVTDASAQRKKNKKKKNKEKTEQKMPDSRIINTKQSEVCEVFTVENPDLVKISRNFANMNLRRRVGDYGPNEYSAYYWWNKMYDEAPGFSILIYTDGSAVFREMANKAKEEGDTVKFNEYAERSLELLDEGEKCFPDSKGKFGPSKAYIYELLYPNKSEEILKLYTTGFNENTDPYSLISIARYSQYLGYIGKLDQATADEWTKKCQDVVAAHPDNEEYKYSGEVISAILDTYEESRQQLAAQKEQQQKVNEEKADNSLYNQMVSEFKANNIAGGYATYRQYIGTVTDMDRKYKVAMYAARNLMNAKDYTNARTAFQDASSANPSSGEPDYFIGLMYLSSGPLCGPGTGFESQRVIWAAFDRFNSAKAKTISAETASNIASNIASYKDYLPTNAQLAAEGLSVGSTYTVTCWINETVTVSSKESF